MFCLPTTRKARLPGTPTQMAAASSGRKQLVTTGSRLSDSSLVPADIDGDGDPDVVAASWSDEEDKIAWYENTDGRGTFGPEEIISTTLGMPRRVVAADLDGDLDMDVLAAGERTVWYQNVNGTGVFGSARYILPDFGASGHVSARDLDGDGHLDVLAAYYDEVSALCWHPNDSGDGSFRDGRLIGVPPMKVCAVGDLDDDQDTDLVGYLLNRRGLVHLYWMENMDGARTFGNGRAIATGLQGSIPLVHLGDIDADRDLDVVVTIGDRTSVYRNLLDSAAVTATPTPTGTPDVVVPTATPEDSWAAEGRRSDIDGTGRVDVDDLLIFRAHWHETVE